MKQRYVTTLLFLLSVVVCYSEEIKIQDMGDASLEAEGDVTSVRMTDKKRAWNESPVHINIEPGDDQSADAKQFDFVRKFERTKIACKGKMEASGETHMQVGALATFDVTAVVRLWYEGKLENNGWSLVTPGKGNYIRFYASNGDGMAPRLDVEVE